MNLTIKSVLILIGAILVVISSFVRPQDRVDLFKLGLGLVILALLL